MKGEVKMTDFLARPELHYIFRILLAGICGMIIGLERKNRSKEAGIRTHFVVACGAALMMVVSKYAFFDVIGQGMYEGVEVRLDPSRIASTIASGIGFLGAGMIFVHKNNITGLTTAAGIWATSGVGMAIGSGMYTVGITATIIILIAQIVLHMRGVWSKATRAKILTIKGVDSRNYQEQIVKKLEAEKVHISDISVEKNGENNVYKYIFSIEFPESLTEDKILSLIDYDATLKSRM